MQDATTLAPMSADYAQGDKLKPMYMETLQLIERLHRRLLDVVKDEFDRSGRSDVNAVQALLLFNIGDAELTAGELRSRGYYQGSNVSYNLKKLVEMGFIDHERSRTDRRAVRVRLTQEGLEIAQTVSKLFERHVKQVEPAGGMNKDEFISMTRSMTRLDRFWNDTIQYRL